MESNYSGVPHPTHKRKAAQRKAKAHSIKRLKALARKHGHTYNEQSDKDK